MAERPGPVLKWAGGKTQLLAQYEPHFPRRYGSYFEPFVGSAAVFFHLRPRRARLSDVNAELIDLYRVLQADVDRLIHLLAEHRELHGEEHFYRVRAQDPTGLDDFARAARTLYLNKTCYNGLYRVNSRGGFNVPFGRYKNPGILIEGRLRGAARALQGVELQVEGFEKVLDHAQKGDLVYFDPPYMPLSVTSSFTAYTRWSFGEAEQRRLAEVFAELARRKVKVLLSNSDTPLIRDLYAGYRVITVQATRCINSKADGRRAINEVLVASFR